LEQPEYDALAAGSDISRTTEADLLDGDLLAITMVFIFRLSANSDFILQTLIVEVKKATKFLQNRVIRRISFSKYFDPTK
jgi:hypothetical protein